MKPSAVVLIDLENFFCSREDFCRNRGPVYDRARFRDDLEKLLGYARAMTADRATGIELPFTVRRAYADYNAVRYVPGGAQHYLRALPEELLSQGIEPVQVFRLSRGGKNAADMRMAMDATSLLFTAGHIEHFVLVTGDADFIPVILELKRYGHTVSVIGVTNATSPKIQRFVDNFELFEDLLAADEAEAQSGKFAATGEALGLVTAAVQRLLARTHVLRFAAVKPLLSKELGHPFDPGLFGCDSTGDFLRDHQSALGIVVRQGPHDSEITLLGAPAPLPNGTRVASRSPAKPAKAPDPEPHTAAHYRHLLLTPTGTPADREGKVYAVPWSALVWLCDAVVPLLAPPTGEPTPSPKLQSKLIVATEKWAIPDLVKHVRLFYPTLRAGLPVQSGAGVYSLPEETTAARVRHSVLGYILGVLKCRLTESGCAGDIRPDQLAAVFDPGPALDEATAEFTAALAEPVPQPPPRPAKLTPKPAAVVEELHTAAGYVKLLKVGGAKGSETEAFKVLPVPWPSVERICEDTFTLLCPGTGGAPMPRDQLTAKLIDAGKELYIEKYDQHVRRVLGIVRLAGDVSEENGQIALNGAVTDGHNLRSRALGFLLELLRLRLEDRGAYDPIHAPAFATALEAGPLTDRLIAEITPAIAWLYKPVDDEPAEVPPPIEVPAPVPMPEADPDAVPVGLEVDPGPAPTEPLVSEPAPVKPDWDAYSFDGVLPEIDTGNDPLPPEVRHEVELPPAVMMSAPTALPTDPPSGVYRDVDISEITSMAVAAAQGTGPAELDSDEIAFAPMVPESPSGRYAQTPSGRYVRPPSKTFTPEDLLAAVSPDGMPRDEPLFEEIYAAENPIVLAEPEPVSLPPLPLFPPEEADGRVDKMNPPPLPRRAVPPPLPPASPRQPPPESA